PADARLGPWPLVGSGEREAVERPSRGQRNASPRESALGPVFDEQVRRTPDTVAVVCGGERLLYGELAARANRLGRHLRRRGVKAGDRVALCVERSSSLVVGMLGIVKAGAACLPVGATYPAERLRFMIEDARPSLVVADSAAPRAVSSEGVPTVWLDRDAEAIASESPEAFDAGVCAIDLAYVIYTSGSTGVPKGVEVTHRGVL